MEKNLPLPLREGAGVRGFKQYLCDITPPQACSRKGRGRFFSTVEMCECGSRLVQISTVPRITGTQLPATVAYTGPSAVFLAPATISLGRPISTPC